MGTLSVTVVWFSNSVVIWIASGAGMTETRTMSESPRRMAGGYSSSTTRASMMAVGAGGVVEGRGVSLTSVGVAGATSCVLVGTAASVWAGALVGRGVASTSWVSMTSCVSSTICV